MKPIVQFHDIAAMHFGEVRTFTREDRTMFATRDLRFIDKDGRAFKIELYAATPDALRVTAEDKVATVRCDEAPVEETIPPAYDKAGKAYPW